jgi:hypothetical protein
MQQPKIPMSAIDDARRVLEDVPDHDVTEVSKAQAVRLLSPQIHAMQSKGYSLAHIASVLSNKGISITGVTLRNYLNQLRSEAKQKTNRKGNRDRTRSRSRSGSGGDKPPATMLNESATGLRTATGSDREQVARENVVRITPRSGPSAADVTEPAKPVAPRGEQVPRRSGFTPRRDTEDI